MKNPSLIVARLRRIDWLVFLVALVQVGLHLWANAHDNLFRDELYYLAAAQHPDLGYVDFPPFIALVAGVSRAVFGSTPLAIRVLPTLAGALEVFIVAAMAAELGSSRRTQLLATIAIALGPIFLGSSGLLTMDIFDQLWWFVIAWVLLRLIKRQEPRVWLIFGLVAGIGLITKVTMAFFGFALVMGVLLTPQRRLLFNRWLVLGGLVALVIFSPYIIWQVIHGFPTLEFWKVYAASKTYPVTPLEFFGQQVTTLNPFALPLWLAGLFFLFFSQTGKPYRAFGWAYLILYVTFTLQKTKFYFLSPAYPVLFASGAFAFELLAQRSRGWRWLQPAIIGLLTVTGLAFAPLSIPLLSAEGYIRYNTILGGTGSVKMERLQESALPQTFADRFGWKEMVAAIAQVYDSLSVDEKADVCILTSDYGQAGAVDFYGPAYGLPKAISGHNSYFIWGPDGCSGIVVISVGYSTADTAPSFRSTQQVGQVHCTYCMPFENGAPIVVSRGLKFDIQQIWPQVKAYK